MTPSQRRGCCGDDVIRVWWCCCKQECLVPTAPRGRGLQPRAAGSAPSWTSERSSRGWPAGPGWLPPAERPARCDLRREQRVHQLTAPTGAAGGIRLRPSPDSLPSSSWKRSNRPLKYTLCSAHKAHQSHGCTPAQHAGPAPHSPVTPLQLRSHLGSSSKLLPLASQPP